MPTVYRIAGYRLYFDSNEPNEPPHIHVDKAGASAKIWLERIAVARNIRFAPHELAEVVRLVQQSRARLIEAWDEFFD